MSLERISQLIERVKAEGIEPRSIVIGGFHAEKLAEELYKTLPNKDSAGTKLSILSGANVMGLPVVYVGDHDIIMIGRD